MDLKATINILIDFRDRVGWDITQEKYDEYFNSIQSQLTQLKADNTKLREGLKEYFINGYEKGHNDTVESQYMDGSDVWDDRKDELLKELEVLK